MDTRQPKLTKRRAEAAVAALVVVMSIATGSAVLAQDSSDKSAAPSASDKPAADDKMGKMGMGPGGMMGMMPGQMKCCRQGMSGQGMGKADQGAGQTPDEKK